jgi:hypothetical protein
MFILFALHATRTTQIATCERVARVAAIISLAQMYEITINKQLISVKSLFYDGAFFVFLRGNINCCVEARPCLWDIGSEEYKDRGERRKSLSEIAELLDVSSMF